MSRKRNVRVGKVDKTWTGNVCYGCGRQATAQIDFSSEIFDECIDLCTSCFRSIVQQREKLYGRGKGRKDG